MTSHVGSTLAAQDAPISDDQTPQLPLASADPDLDDEAPSGEFAAALDDFERHTRAVARTPAELAVGSQVRGTVVSIGDEHLVVDFGGRSEGVAETHGFRNEDGTLRVDLGAVVDLFVVESGEQVVLAPAFRPDPHVALRQVREAHAAGVPVSGRVTGVNAGGLAVDIGGVRGFCPVSQIEAGYCSDASVYVGRTLEFLVTQLEEARGGAVLSRRQLLRRADEERGRQLLASIKPGDELDGSVARLEAFGAFVNLGGVDGLVHVSEIRHERTEHPRDALKEGQKVRVRVLKIDAGKDGRPRIALSIRAGLPDPWVNVGERFVTGARYRGRVARLTEFGAFVTLAAGIDGLVHVSEAALSRVSHVKEVLSVGEEVEVAVLGVDLEKKRISLSIKEVLAATLPPPRAPAVGDVIDGRVSGIKPFGVFVDLPDYGPRVAGLVPREETGEPRGADLSRTFAIGQGLRVEVVELKEGRIRLSLARAKLREEAAHAQDFMAEPRTAEPPLTTMAIALRKAMERDREKGRAPGGESPAGA